MTNGRGLPSTSFPFSQFLLFLYIYILFLSSSLCVTATSLAPVSQTASLLHIATVQRLGSDTQYTLFNSSHGGVQEDAQVGTAPTSLLSLSVGGDQHTELSLSLSSFLNMSSPSNNYRLTLSWDDEELSISPSNSPNENFTFVSGVVNSTHPSAAVTFNVSCLAQGTHTISSSLLLYTERNDTDDAFDGIAQLISNSFAVECQQQECMCNGKGVCDEQLACICEKGYTHDPQCSFGFDTLSYTLCPFERTSLWFDFADKDSAEPSFDWIAGIGASHNFTSLSELEEYGTEPQYFWSYTGDVLNCTYDFFFEEEGDYAVAYFPFDNLSPSGFVMIHVLSLSDPRCWISRTGSDIEAEEGEDDGEEEGEEEDSSVCGDNGVLVDGMCVCDEGFTGAVCEYGCPPLSLVNDWTGTLTPNDNTSLNFYSRDVHCVYIVSPLLPKEVNEVERRSATSIDLYFPLLYLGEGGSLSLFSGNSTSEADRVRRWTGPIPHVSVSVSLSSSSFTLVLDAHEGWYGGTTFYPHVQTVNGFELQYKGKGCPPGYHTASGSCKQTAPGFYSAGFDEMPLACPRHTYSSSAGATECQECPSGMFTYRRRSTECLACQDHGYPFSIDRCNEVYNLNEAEYYLSLALGLLALTFSLCICMVFGYGAYIRQPWVIGKDILFQSASLVGFSLMAIASILYIQEPTKVTCSSSVSLSFLGKTLGLVPPILHTIRARRIFLSRSLLSRRGKSPTLYNISLAVVLLCASLFICLWMTIAPHEDRGEYVRFCTQSKDQRFMLPVIIFHISLLLLSLWVSRGLHDVPDMYTHRVGLTKSFLSHCFVFMLLAVFLIARHTISSGIMAKSIANSLLSLLCVYSYFGYLFKHNKTKRKKHTKTVLMLTDDKGRNSIIGDGGMTKTPAVPAKKKNRSRIIRTLQYHISVLERRMADDLRCACLQLTGEVWQRGTRNGKSRIAPASSSNNTHVSDSSAVRVLEISTPTAHVRESHPIHPQAQVAPPSSPRHPSSPTPSHRVTSPSMIHSTPLMMQRIIPMSPPTSRRSSSSSRHSLNAHRSPPTSPPTVARRLTPLASPTRRQIRLTPIGPTE